MEQKLEGIPETMLIPLWARAVESRQTDPIIKDDKAVEIISRIDYDFSNFNKAWLSQVGVSVRTMLLDNATLDFLQRKPNAIVINLGAGLDTRLERLKHDNIGCWYDLDVPEAIELRRIFFTESDKNRFIVRSIFDFSWLGDIEPTGKAVLIIAEGLFMYFKEDELKPLFRQLVTRFPGAEILFDKIPPALAGKSKYHDSVSKIGSTAEFKWGLKDGKKMETWDERISFVEEWDYYDYHRNRWKWFGFIGRLPLIGQLFSSGIVHLKFI